MAKLTAWKCFSVVMAVFLILGVAAVAIPATAAGVGEGTWELQTVDVSDVSSTSLALDSYGYPHIAYTTGGPLSVHYAGWTGTSWETELVDDVPALVASLALDSDNHPRICYCTLEFDSLYYAYRTGTGWKTETVDSCDVTDCSLALDSHGYPHISYTLGDSGDVMYAYLTDSGWEFDTVWDCEPAINCSLAMDNANRPHISFCTIDTSLHYAYLTGGCWTTETVDDGFVTASSIALDSHGSPHIAYAMLALGSLHYASRTGEDAWTTQTVDPANTADCSLAMDSNDRPHISYFVGSGGLVAPPAGEGEPVEQGIDGFTLTGALKYAVWTGSEWNIETVDQETLHIDGPTLPLFGDKWCSLALDEDDLPHISYGNLLIGFIDHSCRYAVFVMPAVPEPAGLPKYSPPMPNINRYLSQANMSVQFVSVNPQKTLANQPVTITTNVVNTGDAAGNYNVDLKINGQVEESRMISVGPQASQPVKFTVTRDQPGTYTVDIVDKSSSFTVLGDSAAGGTSGQNNTGLIILILMGVLIVATVVVLLVRRS